MGTETEDTLQLSRNVQMVGVPGRACGLFVYHREGARVVPLEPDAAVVVGRAAPADLIVSDAALSRRHARFRTAKAGLPRAILKSPESSRDTLRVSQMKRAAGSSMRPA